MDAPEDTSSSSSSFFHMYKELFEYEKHMGSSDDPVTLSRRDGIGAKTFLDKYRECEQRQAMGVRAGLQFPLVATLMVDTMRPHGIPLSSTFLPFTTSMTMPQQQHYHQQPERTYLQTFPPQKASPAPSLSSSSFTRSKLENSLRQSASNQEKATATSGSFWSTSTSSYYNATQSPERTSPQYKKQASPSKAAAIQSSMPPPSLSLDTSKTHARNRHAAVERSTSFQLPKLADLLIDSSTRSATLRHKHLDEAKKIELLIGNNCGGRISSASTNLPPSIRRRLQASVRAEQRREQLYSVLRQDYQELCHHQ